MKYEDHAKYLEDKEYADRCVTNEIKNDKGLENIIKNSDSQSRTGLSIAKNYWTGL